MGRQRDLAELVGFTLKRLRKLAADRESCYWTRELQINGKMRKITCPFGAMRRLHERLKHLFNRIQQPSYLYSPRHGVSAPMNAAAHIGAKEVVKLDVRQFYPSTTDEHVFRFFFHELGMRADVAGLLTKLATFRGRVPFGSPLSPVLCALVHRDIFDDIHACGTAANSTFTLWVDDLT